ncbi:MAG: hypothetical protein GY714_32370 [Desulfobacterales bacterium]|nr:hypothetical protein [Desulfobacterales bacterium]
MAEDIRISLSFKNNRKKKKLQKKLGAEGVLSLFELWMSVATNKPSGVLTGYDAFDIEIDAEWNGEEGLFVETLLDCQFLDVDENGVYSLHNWDIRQPWVYQSPDRSDKARFSRLAKVNNEIYEKLKKDGVNAISKKDYLSLTNAVRVDNEASTSDEDLQNDTPTDGQQDVNESSTDGETEINETLTERQGVDNETSTNLNESSTPAPAPAPVPSPALYASAKIENLVRDFQKEVSKEHGKLAPKVTNALIKNGCKAVENLIRIDGFELEYIKRVLDFVVGDDFWAKNIKSLASIRKKSTNDLIKFQNAATAFDQAKGNKSHGFNKDYYSENQGKQGTFHEDL